MTVERLFNDSVFYKKKMHITLKYYTEHINSS